ncbi:MAG TPA: hypothetical protein EYP43_00025, partial [Thermoplasmata archaeon]|nr:hypothetical protein [Thermoplasmata archaeon]
MIATDAAGNTNRSTISAIHVDNTDPSITIHSPSVGVILSGNVTLNATVTDANLNWSAVEWWRDGGVRSTLPHVSGDYFGTRADTVSDAWPDGTYNVSVRAVDNATNERTARVEITIDNTAPEIRITDPEDEATILTSHNFTVVVVDPHLRTSRVFISFDGGSQLAMSLTAHTGDEYTFIYRATGMAVADHTITVSAEDRAGNFNSTSIDVTVESGDVIGPTITFISPIDEEHVNVTEFDLVVEVVDPNRDDDAVWYWLDGDRSDNVSMSRIGGTDRFTARITGIEGTMEITVRAEDIYRNPSEASIDVTIDVTPPVVHVTSPTTGSVVGGMMYINVTVDDLNLDPTDGAWYRWDNGSPRRLSHLVGTAFSRSVDTGTLTDGAHTLTIYGYDLAGNSDNVTITDITVDNTRPRIEVISPVEGAMIDTPYTFNVSVRDANVGMSGVTIALWNETPVTMTHAGANRTDPTVHYFTHRFDHIRPGPRNVTIVATDLAGNTRSLLFHFNKSGLVLIRTIVIDSQITVTYGYEGEDDVTAARPTSPPLDTPTANHSSLGIFVTVTHGAGTTLHWVNISIAYTGAQNLGKVIEATIRLYYQGSWVPVTDYCLDTDANIIWANHTSGGTFGLFAERESVAPLPPPSDGGGREGAGLPVAYLVLAVVAIVILVLVLVMRMRRGGGEEEPEGPLAKEAAKPAPILTLEPAAPPVPEEPDEAEFFECTNCRAIVDASAT